MASESLSIEKLAANLAAVEGRIAGAAEAAAASAAAPEPDAVATA